MVKEKRGQWSTARLTVIQKRVNCKDKDSLLDLHNKSNKIGIF